MCNLRQNVILAMKCKFCDWYGSMYNTAISVMVVLYILPYQQITIGETSWVAWKDQWFSRGYSKTGKESPQEKRVFHIVKQNINHKKMVLPLMAKLVQLSWHWYKPNLLNGNPSLQFWCYAKTQNEEIQCSWILRKHQLVSINK